ncbi:MAG: glycoside hydrolase family 3 protein [Hyphomicrobiaceae bacterium]|nr:glycoside hydrolase family 3 protein [Hyphomicrobiaceae bacterium]
MRTIPKAKDSKTAKHEATQNTTAQGLQPPDPKTEGKPLTLNEKKAAVLAAPPEVLQRIGRHVITGYHASGDLKPLLERGAVGGIFVTARNARGRNKPKLAAELAEYRKLAVEAGQNTFWISTDQEGGSVSRLSPPLPYQRALPRIIGASKTTEERHKATETFAEKQAADLSSIGINLNFAPVADLNHNVRSSADKFTKIRYRAISDDPAIVTEVAKTYCEALAKSGIYCTLKHFPGLGRVLTDTHITSGHLKVSTEILEKTDWIPFRQILSNSPAFLMISHAQLSGIDNDKPASTSPKIIQNLLRETWKFNGVIVTDDLAMGAIVRRYNGGMAQAAIDALNAGADLVLVGSDGGQVYDVLYSLILADERGELDPEKLKLSHKRLETAAKEMNRSPPATADDAANTAAAKTKTARQ